MSPIFQDRLKRLLYRLGIAHPVRHIAASLNSKLRAENAKNRIILDRIGSEKLLSIQRQVQSGIELCTGTALVSPMDGGGVMLQLPVIAGLIAHGLEPIILLPSKASREEQYLFRCLGVRRFAFWDEFGECKSHQEALQQLRSSKTQEDLLNIKWEGIAVGKYAVSTLMRRLRLGRIDPSNPRILDQLIVMVRQVVDHAFAAQSLVRRWVPDVVVLIDRGYTPEGPLFEVSIKQGLRTVTMNSGHRDNVLILKSYDPSNADVHPASLSTTTWERLLSMSWTHERWGEVRREIEYCYKTGQWYGQVATQHGTELFEREAIIAKLGIDPTKRTVIVFPHIFWDATFFWGADVFGGYEDWFKETIKVAIETSTVNWVIKVHPANVMKNIRDGQDALYSELKVLAEFGELPSHIRVIPADTNISTLSLYSIGDICLTVRGTVGIEAAAFGLSVVTAGTGRYDRLGFTTDVSSRDSYCELLANIANVPTPSEKQVELARRYAYGVFLVRPLEMESIAFSYQRTREARLEISPSQLAYKGLLECRDVQAIKAWLSGGEQDT